MLHSYKHTSIIVFGILVVFGIRLHWLIKTKDKLIKFCKLFHVVIERTNLNLKKFYRFYRWMKHTHTHEHICAPLKWVAILKAISTSENAPGKGREVIFASSLFYSILLAVLNQGSDCEYTGGMRQTYLSRRGKVESGILIQEVAYLFRSWVKCCHRWGCVRSEGLFPPGGAYSVSSHGVLF